MDPATIGTVASSAGTVINISWKVYEFIQSAKHVDITVQEIQKEMRQLNAVCKMVESRTAGLAESDKDLLKLIRDEIAACTAPAQTISDKLAFVDQKMGLFKKSIRQLKLDMSQEDIRKCRRQISGALANLQLTLALASLQTNFIVNGRADQDLSSSIDGIKSTLADSETGIHEDVRTCADIYLARGTTLYARSIGNGSVIGKSRTTTSIDWLNSIGELKILLGTSRTIDDPPIAQETSSDSAIDLPSIANHEVDHDSDEETLDSEIATNNFTKAKQAFETKGFQLSNVLLREFVSLVKGLPLRQKLCYDLDEIQLMLAISTFFLHPTATAEVALSSVMDPEFGKHTNLQMQAVDLLGITYARQNKTELARMTYDNLYRAQRRIFGPGDACNQTLGRLSVMYSIECNWDRALSYRTLIPAKTRADWCREARKAIGVGALPKTKLPSGPVNLICCGKADSVAICNGSKVTLWPAFRPRSLQSPVSLCDSSHDSCADVDESGEHLLVCSYSSFWESWTFTISSLTSCRKIHEWTKKFGFYRQITRVRFNMSGSSVCYIVRDGSERGRDSFVIANSKNGTELHTSDVGRTVDELLVLGDDTKMLLAGTAYQTSRGPIPDKWPSVGWIYLSDSLSRRISNFARSSPDQLAMILSDGSIEVKTRNGFDKASFKTIPSKSRHIELENAVVAFRNNVIVAAVTTSTGRSYLGVPEQNDWLLLKDSDTAEQVLLDMSRDAKNLAIVWKERSSGAWFLEILRVEDYLFIPAPV